MWLERRDGIVRKKWDWKVGIGLEGRDVMGKEGKKWDGKGGIGWEGWMGGGAGTGL